MYPADQTDLTYSEFVKLRAAALRSLHAAQASQSRVLDPRYTTLTDAAAVMAQEAVTTAQNLLAALLDRWHRSKYNRGM